MSFGPNIVVYSGLLIGLVFGSVGLLSGFCLLSSLRGWWGEGDGRLVRTYALAISVAVLASQLLVLGHYVDLDKSIYLQASFSAPLMFLAVCCSATAWCCRMVAHRGRWCCLGVATCVLSSSS